MKGLFTYGPARFLDISDISVYSTLKLCHCSALLHTVRFLRADWLG